MNDNRIDTLRRASRKLVRELGIVQLDKSLVGPTTQHCHALVEIGEKPGITVSQLAALLLLSVSAASRLVHTLVERGFVEFVDGVDKREKSLSLSIAGKKELKNIDDYSKAKVQGAFEYLSDVDQELIVQAIEKYGQALENSRQVYCKVKILTLSTSRPLRKQIAAMVYDIQKNEFDIPVTEEVNACILRAEDDFYYNNSCNFWYAVDDKGGVIGCIGLKKIDAENGELKKVFVDKRFRGKGVAQQLMAVVAKAGCKHGFSKIWLGTVQRLASAHAFYTKCGFEQIEEQKLPKAFVKGHLDSVFYCGIVDKIK